MARIQRIGREAELTASDLMTVVDTLFGQTHQLQRLHQLQRTTSIYNRRALAGIARAIEGLQQVNDQIHKAFDLLIVEQTAQRDATARVLTSYAERYREPGDQTLTLNGVRFVFDDDGAAHLAATQRRRAS